MNYLKVKKNRRKTRVRSKLFSTKDRLRLSVHRSNKHIYAQIIDDSKKVTLLGVSEKDLKDKKGTKSEKAKSLGLIMASKAKSKKVNKIIFDKGPFAYHGRIKSFAEGLREGGLNF